MKISLEEVEGLKEIEVLVKISTHNQEALKLYDYLQNFEGERQVIAISNEKGIEIVGIEEIVAIEVYQGVLTFYLQDRQVTSRGTLQLIREKLTDEKFIQISKSVVIDYEKIKRLETYFSGNLLAFCENGEKFSVSRRYVKALYQTLGI